MRSVRPELRVITVTILLGILALALAVVIGYAWWSDQRSLTRAGTDIWPWDADDWHSCQGDERLFRGSALPPWTRRLFVWAAGQSLGVSKGGGAWKPKLVFTRDVARHKEVHLEERHWIELGHGSAHHPAGCLGRWCRFGR
jgi:hypothetical protein